jgi:hypothetical protein
MPVKVGLQSKISSTSPNIKNGSINLTSARVVNIILDDKTNPELFKELGEWSSIGVIFFESPKIPYKPDNFELYKENIAYPLFPNIKNYPLINEIVYIINLPSTDIQTNTTSFRNYYFSPINNWNSIHHNAIPNTIFNSLLPESQQKDYTQTSGGNVRRVTDGSTEIPLGNTFVEKTDIKSLLPYEGDVIYEGRWGNSMRIGSTVNNAYISNNWSTSGNNGDPLIILRNGQYNDGKDPWIPIIEDINKDKSSVYITSTQKIPLKASQTNYKSYTTEAPLSPDQYSGNQIILNSGRLVFNSNLDHILLSSAKTISFNAVQGFNFDTNKNFVVNSKQIKLGSKDATEPLLLGNKTIILLQQILNSLQLLSNVLPSVGTTVPGAPNIAVASAAANLSATLNQLIPQLESLKSKQNFTI